jgi:RNA polymerase sigma factor (sigma-70 family)
MTPEEFKIQVLPLKNRLFRLALRLLGRVEEAEDVVQDALIKLWTRKDELESYSSVEAFAMTITKNLCLDRIRSKGFQTERIPERQVLNVSGEKEEKLEREDFDGFVRKIISSLPDQQRAIMQMRDIEGLEYEQIAEVMELNINAIRVNLSRARKKVRDTILKIQGYELARN